MPRPLPPGGQRRRAVLVKMTDAEARPARALADADHDGNLSEAIRRIVAEWSAARTYDQGYEDGYAAARANFDDGTY